jgi:hypothetical protein
LAKSKFREKISFQTKLTHTFRLVTFLPDNVVYYILGTTFLAASIISNLIAAITLFLACRGFWQSFSSVRNSQKANLLNRGQLGKSNKVNNLKFTQISATSIKLLFFQAIGIAASICLVTFIVFRQRIHSLETCDGHRSGEMHPDSFVAQPGRK